MDARAIYGHLHMHFVEDVLNDCREYFEQICPLISLNFSKLL